MYGLYDLLETKLNGILTLTKLQSTFYIHNDTYFLLFENIVQIAMKTSRKLS